MARSHSKPLRKGASAQQPTPPRALSIAGSDSGGGAGIQADLKTFAALGVHGTTAITAITAQNTKEVVRVLGVPPEMVISQIEAVKKDIGFDALKTGMLFDAEIVTIVSEYFRRNRHEKIVVDPVMVSKSGASLLQRNAVEVLIEKLLPISYVVTPNIDEAKLFCGVEKIEAIEDAETAAKTISEFGPKVVVVKGGHLRRKNDEVIDTVYFRCTGKFEHLKSKRFLTKNTHGTGCVFSAAIAAELAKGNPVADALKKAKSFVSDAIKNSLNIGEGSGPVNPSAQVLKLSDKFLTLSNEREAIDILMTNGPSIAPLIPELRSNIGMAVESASGYDDIVAVPGRITAISKDRIGFASAPEFGSSRHIANAILGALQFDRRTRAAMNIRYSEELVDTCDRLGLVISSYDRRLEPPEVKKTEGASTLWGARQAIAKSKRFPNVIYHKGDFGKEPMIVLLGTDAVSVARMAVEIGKKNIRMNF